MAYDGANYTGKTKVQIQKLTKAQVTDATDGGYHADLSVTQLKWLQAITAGRTDIVTDLAASPTSAPAIHITNFNIDLIRAIDTDGTIIEKFTSTQLKALTPAQIKELKVGSIKDMITAYATAGTEPTAAQIQGINPALLTKASSDADFIQFTATQINSMSNIQLGKLVAFNPTPAMPELVSELSARVLATVKASLIGALDDTEKAALTAKQIQALSPEKIILLEDTAGTAFQPRADVVSALSAAQIKALHTAGVLANFSDDQLANLNGTALAGAGLTGAQQVAIFDTVASQVSDSNAAGLTKEVLATFTTFDPATLTLLTTTGLKAIPPAAIAGMDATASATLTANQFAVLTPAQVKMIAHDDLRGG